MLPQYSFYGFTEPHQNLLIVQKNFLGNFSLFASQKLNFSSIFHGKQQPLLERLLIISTRASLVEIWYKTLKAGDRNRPTDRIHSVCLGIPNILEIW